VWTASFTPFFRDSIWNGKPAPSPYLHKQLDVTPSLGLEFCRARTQIFQEVRVTDFAWVLRGKGATRRKKGEP
jgi:hypothetical protein